MKSKLYFWLGLICLRILRVFIRLSYAVDIAKIRIGHWQRICAIRHIGNAKIAPIDKIRLLSELE